MTTPVQDNKITLECDGATTEFEFSFKYLINSDIKVYVVDIGVAATEDDLQTEGSDYTLTSTDKAVGGTITFGTAPADTKQVFIIRKNNLTQTASFKPNTNFPEQVIESALDKLTMITQELNEVGQRCVKLPINSDITGLNLPTPEAGKTLKWNETEDGFDNSDTFIDDIQASLDAAEESAAEAAASAELAQAATGVVPTPVALNYLRQKSDTSGFEYRTPAQVAGDIKSNIAQQIGTSSTASATAEKAVVCEGFELVTGVTIQITFSNANTNATPTLNINSTGAKSLKNMQGDALSYIPASIKLPFLYDGTNIIGLYTNTFATQPDFSSSISKTWNTIYQAESDGWLYVYAYVSGGATAYLQYSFNSGLSSPISIWNNVVDGEVSNGDGGLFVINKGVYYKAYGGTSGQQLKFYPAKGAK